jgi:SAM-dependent methyltransferase
MADQIRPYAIHSDSECDRLERQAGLAGLENHLRHVPVPETARILDAGCGSGAMTRCFGSRYADASVIGVDIRDDYVSYARARAKEDGLQNVEFRRGSVFDLPFANSSFDVVWSKYVMQWIGEPEKAVAEFRRVTKPGGIVVCVNFDGFAVTHYPEDVALQHQILTVFPHLVDVYIGRKTAPIFYACGLIDISVVFEPDSLFTTVGAIDPERRENWIAQLEAARPYIAEILGGDEAAREFGDSFVRYYDRPDTSSYTALYFVRGQVPSGKLESV